MTDRRPFYILGAAAIVLLLVFIFLGRGGDRFDWSEHFEEDSKDPYGLFVIHQMLNSYFGSNTFAEIENGLDEELPLGETEKSNYIFIGESMFLDSADVAKLLEYVREGNNAFISSKTIPFDMMFEIYYDECNYEPWDDYETMTDSSATLNLVHQQLDKKSGYKYDFIYENSKTNYGWNYIDSVYFCEEDFSLIELGVMNDRFVNFAKKEYGEGSFYLHTTPVAFSNIQMLDKVGLKYANKVFSHLNEGDIYWDKYSRVSEGFGRAVNRRSRGGGSHSIASDESLKFILAQPSLSWAWYIALALGTLFLIFRAKRRQRTIPVLESNENTSFQFISTIGTLYFLQNDHKKLCLQKMKLFLSYIRDRYNLPTNQLDDTFKQKLLAKSEVPSSLIDQIFKFYKNIETSSFVSEQTLIDFHLEMDKFYKNCK